MLKCPKCRLASPDEAQRCDCGYDFVSKTVQMPYDRRATARHVPLGAIIGATLLVSSPWWILGPVAGATVMLLCVPFGVLVGYATRHRPGMRIWLPLVLILLFTGAVGGCVWFLSQLGLGG